MCEVSKLIGISSQTLRYYDKIGVVKPAFVHEAIGYRHTDDCGFNSLPFRDKRPYVPAEPININEPIYGYAGYRLYTEEKLTGV